MSPRIVLAVKTMPHWSIALCAILFLGIILYTYFRSREISTLKSKYQTFQSRDHFIEDLINSTSRRSTHAVLFLVGLLLLAGFSGFYSSYNKGSDIAPGGVEELEAHLSMREHEFESLKLENEQLTQRVAVMTGQKKPGLRESQILDGYRNALVNYFYLLRCNASTMYDGMTILSMLSLELRVIGSDADKTWETLVNAKQMHDQMYSKGPCEEATIAPMVSSNKTFVEAALKGLQRQLTLVPVDSKVPFSSLIADQPKQELDAATEAQIKQNSSLLNEIKPQEQPTPQASPKAEEAQPQKTGAEPLVLKPANEPVNQAPPSEKQVEPTQ